MVRRTLLPTLAAMLVLLAACMPITPGGTVPPAGDTPVSSETPAPASDNPLDGTFWQLTSLSGDDGALAPVADGIEATLRFDGGDVGGSGGCNNFGGTYTVEGANLLWGGAFFSTMMACEEPAMSTEGAYLGLLEQVTTFAIDGDVLRLSNSDGNVILEFAPRQSSPLTGTTWTLINVNNGNEAVVGLAEETVVTVVFGDDGQLSGQACNTFFGPYTVDGETIAIGPLAATMMACPEPEGVMEQEAQVLAALEQAATWSTDGTMLQVRSAEDALLAIFVAE